MRSILGKAYSQYGASMGRRSYHARERDAVTSRLRLERVRLDSGGYDNGGAYWGSGMRGEAYLYRVEGSHTTGLGDIEPIEFFLRADDRDHAKSRIREMGYTQARFYR